MLTLFSSFFCSITDINKGSPIDYKSGSACSTPTKDTLKFDRNYSGPVLPPRSAMCGAPSHHYSAPLNFRKGIAAKCSWKCTAIAVILLSAVLLSILILITGKIHRQSFSFSLIIYVFVAAVKNCDEFNGMWIVSKIETTFTIAWILFFKKKKIIMAENLKCRLL